MIEVEKKSLISEDTYGKLGAQILAMGGVDLGVNNTASVFFLASNWQLKIQHLISKREAKIAWKSGGNDGSSARQEVEIALSPSDVEKAQKIVQTLTPDAELYSTHQDRHDYSLDGVNIAVKFSPDWEYHVELDVTTERSDDIENALQKIHSVAGQLGLKVMSDEEEASFVQQAIERRRTSA